MINLKKIPREVVDKLNFDLAYVYRAIPISYDDKTRTLTVVADRFCIENQSVKNLEFFTNSKIKLDLNIMSSEDMDAALKEYFYLSDTCYV